MSDFHYYEFQKIDCRLTSEEISKTQQLSSRIKNSGKQATFIYHYGSFRADQTLASDRVSSLSLSTPSKNSNKILG